MAGAVCTACISAAHLPHSNHTTRIICAGMQIYSLLLRVRRGCVHAKTILLGRVSYYPPSYNMPPPISVRV